MESKKGADSLRTALENGFGPQMATSTAIAPAPVDHSVPVGMTHVKRITREEVLAELPPNFSEHNDGDPSRSVTGILKANDPLGFPGKFRLKLGVETRLLVIVEPEIRKEGRRIKKQITAFFDRLPGSDYGVTYSFKNPVHCANLRCNQYIEEVF